jgi:preprotein translocase subunit SecB
VTDDTDSEFLAQLHKASRLAARAEIADVRLLRTEAALQRQPDPDRRLSYDIELEPAADWNEEIPHVFVVRIACRLNIDFAEDDEPGEDADDDITVATINFEYAALFNCDMREDDDPLTEEELYAYAQTTARFALYPYIREYVYDLTGRLAIPPLTLGVLARPMPSSSPD